MGLRIRGMVVLALLGLVSCKRADKAAMAQGVLRLGYFPNITHAQALVGDDDGTFRRALGDKLQTRQFNAGPAAMEALVAGSLDAAYVGPGPAINTYLRAGKRLRVIAGATLGGAVLVTRTATRPEQLRGKTVATPQLGNTQDIALRHWLAQQGLSVVEGGKGDVTVTPVSNPDILGLYLGERLEGAWVPEPWGARLMAEAGGQILVDERTLWPDGRFPTTVLVTTEELLRARPEQIRQLLAAHQELTERWRKDPAGFAQATNHAFGKLTRHPLAAAVLEQAFSRLEPSVDPVPSALKEMARQAHGLGFLPSEDIEGLVDTRLLSLVSMQPTPP